MNSIPANQLVSVIPSVLSAGGNPLSLNAVFLTANTSVPIGTVPAFATLQAVKDYFGSTSAEATLAAVYFSGFTGALKLPSTLYFSQYNAAAVAGYLRSAGLAGMTLTQLQALSGTITLSIDGVSTVSAAINLSSATSFTNAAALIQTGIRAGTPVNTVVVTYSAQLTAFVITSPTTGALSAISVAATSALATGLKLTAATSAIVSPGAAAATPGAAMDTIVSVTQNWATFLTVFEPVTATKILFATWVSQVSEAGQERFVYSAWDSDTAPLAGPAPTSFGPLVVAAAYSGVVPIYDPDGKKAAFFCGTTASIDFTQTQGRITFAFKNQAGLVADITDATVADNLISNGYNFYGSYATANQQFTFFQTGSMPGSWKWADSYVNQIWMNSEFQLALMVLLANVRSAPYNNIGYGLIRAALLDPISAALNAGVIQAGVPLSASQAQQVNTAAGAKIDTVLSQSGWYLQILPASAQTRGNRASPPINFFYTDGGSIQQINMASIEIQ